MPKDKLGAGSTKKAAAKAQKKAKAAQKTARKEKKKVTQSQRDDDDQDLQDILDKVFSDPDLHLLYMIPVADHPSCRVSSR